MHGVKRQKYDAELRKRKLAKDVAKIENYRGLTNQFFIKRDSNDHSLETFKLTSTILNINPEFYTVWNYRREILLGTLIPNSQSVNDLFDTELNFTMAQLKKVPKCYWVWTHRQWCLETNPYSNFTKEIFIVNKLLELDSRNFHGWHYRRYVIGLLEKQTGKSQSLKEFQYTTKLINKNFSNYSALHNRTKLIEKIFSEKTTIEADNEEDQKNLELFRTKKHFLEKEINYFKNAIYTDPDDQSVWLYLNWLLTSDFFSSGIDAKEFVDLLVLQINEIDELNELEKEDNNGIDNKWCLKVKSSIELALVNKFSIEKMVNNEGQEITLKEDILKAIELLKIADPKRINRYIEIQKNIGL
ncbi:Rab geranylgeranyltransferase [Saccharomycopsis crataegensis]|uniref:Geranylgeranyl transferase type-2 subunit alpha n=1 Tax=Saccharomycopsis crataegensis TaxID=43959 RepID=A0AAV5QQ09_9ASCO|nr:Rab geranylgeranyltransferase [Saccharomycopsis crataegensis]